MDRSEYADRLAENMENLEWLATVGVRHQRAVAELASKVEMLPARFGTVFLSEHSLQGARGDGKKSFQGCVQERLPARMSGASRCFALRTAPGARRLSEAASGTDYLKRKAQERHATRQRKKIPRWRDLCGRSSRLSVDTAPGGKASCGQPGLVWHGSFLVRRSGAKEVCCRAAKIHWKILGEAIAWNVLGRGLLIPLWGSMAEREAE